MIHVCYRKYKSELSLMCWTTESKLLKLLERKKLYLKVLDGGAPSPPALLIRSPAAAGRWSGRTPSAATEELWELWELWAPAERTTTGFTEGSQQNQKQISSRSPESAQCAPGLSWREEAKPAPVYLWTV